MKKEIPALQLRYEAPDVLPGGASIEKSVRIEDSSSFRVNYRVQLKPAPSDSPGETKHSQSFIAVNSVPVISRADRSTQFCWSTEESKKGAGNDAQDSSKKSCESFKPGRAPLQLPDGANRLEIRTPGKAGLALKWNCAETCARMTIEMKNFSALLNLQFPALSPGGAAGEYSVQFSPLSAETPGSE